MVILCNDNTKSKGNKEHCLTTNLITNNKDALKIICIFQNVLNLADNQMFKSDNDNIKVFTNTGFDPNVCVTHSPTNTLRSKSLVIPNILRYGILNKVLVI